MYAFLGFYLAIQLPLKSLPGSCDVTSFSPCTDSNHKLRDLQHFMSEQIDLHFFKAITAATLLLTSACKSTIKLVPYNS